jgi:chromosome partitioning protein
MPTIITVANQKGGVAKTTSVHNLGDAIGRLTGKKVLLADIDPQFNLTKGVIGKPDPEQLTLGNLLERDQYYLDTEGNKCFVKKEQAREYQAREEFKGVQFYKADYSDILIECEYFDLLPASAALTDTAVRLTMEQAFRSQRLANVLKKISAECEYDYILIDTPATLEILTLNALCASSKVIIPVECESYGTDGLVKLDDVIYDIAENMEHFIDILGVFATKFDKRTRLHNDMLDRIKIDFEKEMLETIIPDNIKVAEAPSYKRSVLEHAPRSSGAIAYMKLAKEILTKLEGE